jgi:hypothetical protein
VVGVACWPFAPVYVNDGLTIDFEEWTGPIPMLHYCSRVDQEIFDEIRKRIKAAGIPNRNNVYRPVVFRINTVCSRVAGDAER